MKHPKGIWLRGGLLPYYFTGHRLALALTEKGYRTAPKRQLPRPQRLLTFL